MFNITISKQGEVLLIGRFDAAQVDTARAVLDTIFHSSVVNFKDLDYISSAGLGILFSAQKRLRNTGHSLKLINMNKHIRDVFYYARFEKIFDIE